LISNNSGNLELKQKILGDYQLKVETQAWDAIGEAVFPVDVGDVGFRAIDEPAGRIKTFDSNSVNQQFPHWAEGSQLQDWEKQFPEAHNRLTMRILSAISNQTISEFSS
jgi:hypothetical protein